MNKPADITVKGYHDGTVRNVGPQEQALRRAYAMGCPSADNENYMCGVVLLELRKAFEYIQELEIRLYRKDAEMKSAKDYHYGQPQDTGVVPEEDRK